MRRQRLLGHVVNVLKSVSSVTSVVNPDFGHEKNVLASLLLHSRPVKPVGLAGGR